MPRQGLSRESVAAFVCEKIKVDFVINDENVVTNVVNTIAMWTEICTKRRKNAQKLLNLDKIPSEWYNVLYLCANKRAHG